MEFNFGLIGYPISHSLSPWIHQTFLKRSNLKGTYGLYEIDPDKSFEEQVEQVRKKKLTGFNITAPYKKKIIPYLDEMDQQANSIGAVNTIVYKEGKWIGYNTDGVGYLRSLIQMYPELEQEKQKNILVIGAGGAARAIVYTLHHYGYNNVDIANRTKIAAQSLKMKYGLDYTNILSLDEAEKKLNHYDIVIQSTSIGMKSNEKIINVRNCFSKNNIVSDIVYQPVSTAFLDDAKEAGARIHYGHLMLLYQAQYAFELWTGELVTINAMEQELLQKLKG